MRAITEPRPFLSANWRHLAMANYRVPSELLEPWVPPGTRLDGYQGRVYVSLVGFLFQNTRLKGITVPMHQSFEEVNLRIYVRRPHPEGWRQGVVFIREIVPRRAATAVARWLYNEPYSTMPMRHEIVRNRDELPERVEYGWRHGASWQSIQLQLEGPAEWPQPGSLASFLTENYWGYTTQRDGGCVEYRVDHPPWKLMPSVQTKVEVDGVSLYGEAFRGLFEREPDSAFLACGSAVTVWEGERIS